MKEYLSFIIVISLGMNCMGKKPEFVAEFEARPGFSKIERKMGKALDPAEKKILLDETKAVLTKRFQRLGIKKFEIQSSGVDNLRITANVFNKNPRFTEIFFRTGGIEFKYADRTLNKKLEAVLEKFGKEALLRAFSENPEKLIKKLEQQAQIPSNREIVFMHIFGNPKQSESFPKPVVLEKESQLTGKDIKYAFDGFEDGRAFITVEMTEGGKEKFKKATSSENLGKNLAVVYDDRVLSMPEIKESITGGRATISSDFSMREAIEIATILSSGAIPIELEVIAQRMQSAN